MFRLFQPIVAGPLEIGLSGVLHIREERLAERQNACRVMYVSDIHLRRKRSEYLSQQVLESARCAAMDVVLLGGDLVDEATELGRLSELVGELRRVARVLAIGGNHDGRVGMKRVQEAVVSGGGEWIQNSFTHIEHGSRVISVFGPDAEPVAEGSVRILCAHNPSIWKSVRRLGYDLVLAGHLHGCQFVAFEYRDRLFPGAAFYPYCYLRDQFGSTRLIVSRGVSDLVPIRWRCPREVVLCYV